MSQLRHRVHPPQSPLRGLGFDHGFSGPPQPPKYPLPPMRSFGSSGTGDDHGRKGILGKNPNESLRTFEIPELDEEATALEFGDWLSMVDSYMCLVGHDQGSGGKQAIANGSRNH